MTQRSWFWGGTSTGDAGLPSPYGAPYSDDMFSDVYQMLFIRDRKKDGVLPSDHTSYSGNLAVTLTSSTATVASGVGICDGKVFMSDASVALTIPSDGSYYIVMRKSWASQTVRLAIIATASLTQSDGVTWDVPLWKFTRSGGAITTSADVRHWVGRSYKRSFAVQPVGIQFTSEVYPTHTELNATYSWCEISFLIPDEYNDSLQVEMFHSMTSGGECFIVVQPVIESWVSGVGGNVEWTPGAQLEYTIDGDVRLSDSTIILEEGGSLPEDLSQYRGQLITALIIRSTDNPLDTSTSTFTIHSIRVTYNGV